MLKVGLTGNIAAGKSTVAEVWRSLGATVDPGTPAFSAIAAEWGEQVVEPDGGLDRAALRRIVFADPAARERLEQIVHPAVAELREELYREAEARGEAAIVADIPLLFEVGLVDEFDVVVLVDAPEETRLARLVGDRGLDPREAQAMIAAQMSSALKRARADYVIENDGPPVDVRRRARDVWQELERRAGGGGG
jgi:dephospho-CoA kinase